MFEIENTSSFNLDKLTVGDEYDYVTRTSFNQGILRSTGFVNEENINSAGNWSLGLLQMDFFYRKKPWYAGQFVRKVHAKVKIPKNAIPFFTVVLNKQKPILLSVLVRDVDKTFCNTTISLPQTADGKIDFVFMENFIRELAAYLKVSGYSSYELLPAEQKALKMFEKWEWKEYKFSDIFNKIKQGQRLKKEDQKPGNIPFVMSGVTDTGIVNYISNPVASFPANSITIDIFGNTFYRNFKFGAGDDTGVYWNDKHNYSKDFMLFCTCAMEKSICGKFSYGKKLRSSQSHPFMMSLISTPDGSPDYEAMETLISAVQKLVIKDVVLYADRKIAAAKKTVGRK